VDNRAGTGWADTEWGIDTADWFAVLSRGFPICPAYPEIRS
jgi:hypothetical protein